MAKYKIAVIGHLLKNNKVAKFGEEVDESQLTSPAKDLVKAGFITEIEAKEIVTISEDVSEKVSKKDEVKKSLKK